MSAIRLRGLQSTPVTEDRQPLMRRSLAAGCSSLFTGPGDAQLFTCQGLVSFCESLRNPRNEHFSDTDNVSNI